MVQYHPEARLTARGRLELIQRVEAGLTVSTACLQVGVSRTTFYRWRRRYHQEGEPGLLDRSSRPHHSPRRLSPDQEQAIASLRQLRGWGPDRIGQRLGLACSTVNLAIHRLGLQRPKPQPQPIIRFERKTPGELISIDTKKLGRITKGPGHRATGDRHGPFGSAGWVVLYAAIDHCSRLVYAELLPDERGATAAGFLARSTTWFSTQGVRTLRVLTDNGSPFCSRAWQQACAEGSIRHRRTRPYRPQTNGKIERWFRTVLGECLYLEVLGSEDEREQALRRFVCYYNAERPHLSLKGLSPLQRLAEFNPPLAA